MFPVSDVIPPRTTPLVTLALIALNVLAFLYELQLNQRELGTFVQQYGVVPAAFTWPSVVSSMFLHSGWLHLGANMLYLWIFGENVEDRLGHVRYALFYAGCGAAAAIVQVAIDPHSTLPLIGASGAVAGVMGAYFVLYPRSRVLTAVFVLFVLDLVEIPAIVFLGLWFLVQLFSGVGSIGVEAADGAIAFFAHVGGFGTGAAGGLYWRLREPYWPGLQPNGEKSLLL